NELYRAAEAWIAEHQGRNLFVYLHAVDPHAPYDPPPPFDAVLTPTLALPPRPIGWFCGTAEDPVDPAEDFERQKRFTPYTAIYNASGQPAASLPLHWTADGLPVGVMLVGRPAGEAALLALCAQLESAAPWADRHPPIWHR
ncbi:MAG: amidase family protein, partial [Jatrophihabitantaceae bacterium]